MGSYKLSAKAEANLVRIHRRGVREFGEARADQYYHDFFERFEELAQHPHLYPQVDHIRQGYRRIMRITGRQDADERL